MIDPPSDRSVDTLADWVELCALFDADDAVSRAETVSALLSTYTNDIDEGDTAHTYDVLLDLVWTRLQERKALMKDAYPFEIQNTVIRRTKEWGVVPAYALLLLCEAGKLYHSVKADARPGSQLPKLFEYVVKAAQPGLFRGIAFRFGWPVDPPDSSEAPKRLKALADAFSVRVLEPESPLGGQDKDAGLDVCARLQLGDQLPGTAFILIQCATGNNWKSKTGEPSMKKWEKYIDWPAATIRAVAIPWRIGKDEERRHDLLNATLEFELAIILDRYRLVVGEPDRWIDRSHAEHIRDWCAERIAELPQLSDDDEPPPTVAGTDGDIASSDPAVENMEQSP